MISLSFLGRVGWYGDPDAAREMLPVLANQGIAAFPLTERSLRRLRTPWTAVLFLPSQGRPDWDGFCHWAMASLDCAVNVVAVFPRDRSKASRIDRLKRLLAKEGLGFVGDAPVEADRAQRIAELSIGGGELRVSPFDPSDLARSLFPVARAPRPGKTKIAGERVSHSTAILLRRAFADSPSIRISRLPGGRASEVVLSVVATVRDKHLLLPFVAKVDTRDQIITETRRFDSHVRDFVPFARRPNMLPCRSIVLASRGILVGQFAERATTLADAVCRNGAVPALNDLFSGVLHRWWANSYRSDEPKQTTIVVSSIRHWIDPGLHPVPELRAKRAKMLKRHWRQAIAMGLSVLRPGQLRGCLRALRSMRLGQIHGDLNARNVLVRDEIPLLIDFSHCMDGPLLADPAWLEVSLVFNWDWSLHPTRTARRLQRCWHAAVRELYIPRWFEEAIPPHLGEPFGDELHRILDAVRLMRRHSVTVATSAANYREIVCAALIRFACSDGGAKEPRGVEACAERAGMAYALASALASGQPL